MHKLLINSSTAELAICWYVIVCVYLKGSAKVLIGPKISTTCQKRHRTSATTIHPRLRAERKNITRCQLLKVQPIFPQKSSCG